jgi:hypothetical protein
MGIAALYAFITRPKRLAAMGILAVSDLGGLRVVWRAP